MYRIVFLLLAIGFLIPLLYLIFFTPFIPRLLRRMNFGRTSDDVTILLEDTEHALANRVRDLEEQKKAADKELSNVGPIKISRTGGDSGSQPATQQNTDN